MFSENKKEIMSDKVELPVYYVKNHMKVTSDFTRKVDEYIEKRKILLERLANDSR